VDDTEGSVALPPPTIDGVVRCNGPMAGRSSLGLAVVGTVVAIGDRIDVVVALREYPGQHHVRLRCR
jgi:hypothetical protein